MKIKTISRSEEQETRSSRHDVLKVHKNTDPKLHPFEKAKEVCIGYSFLRIKIHGIVSITHFQLYYYTLLVSL